MTKKYRLLFELSGEHSELPNAELLSVLETLLNKFDSNVLRVDDRFVIIETDGYSSETIRKLCNRLAMTHCIYEPLIQGSIQSVFSTASQLKKLTLPQNSTFKIITKQIGTEKKPMRKKNGKNDIENETQLMAIKKLTDDIVKVLSTTAKVDVKSPDIEIFLFVHSEIILAKKIKDVNRSAFESRRPQLRPYFAPISLHPRLARCLVNLAGLHDGELVLDPFCGTGGILLEASLMGFPILGSDIDLRMVEGTNRNLMHWGIKNHSLIHSDIEELPKHIHSPDTDPELLKAGNLREIPHAIVTEPPYGRSSAMYGKSMKDLLEKAFKAFHEILPDHGKIVISLPKRELLHYFGENFKPVNIFEIRIHKSLTKYIFVLERTE